MTEHNEITLRSDVAVSYIDHMGSDLHIARAAWNDWMRVPKTDRPLHKTLGALSKDKHGSPFCFGAVIFHVEAPIFVLRQFQRHLIGNAYAGDDAYGEVSTRYTQMLPVFHIPADDRPLKNSGTKMRPELIDDGSISRRLVESDREDVYRQCWRVYQDRLDCGEAEEIAREVLPAATYSAFSVQMNPRSIMNFLQLRVDHWMNTYETHPQYEIERVADQIETHFSRIWPITHTLFTEHGRVAP